MAAERWIFTKSQLQNTPSRKSGIDSDKELSYRQQAANLIQDMGQRLQVTQLCINTAIVYMHRFYMFHSFIRFHRNAMSAACLFLAAKVEEQPRKLEHVIRCSHACLNKEGPPLDVQSNAYFDQAHELVINENILLQTLGFDLSIDHPHTNVVKTCQLVRAPRDLAQTSYFLATNSLHLTTLCLQFKPTVVACVCVHLACKWSNWEIPMGREGKEWFCYVDKSATKELLEELTTEFLTILDKCPNKLRKKIMTWKSGKEQEGPPEKRVKTEPSSAAGSSGQAADTKPSHISASAPKHSATDSHTSSHSRSHEKLPHKEHIKQEAPSSLSKRTSDVTGSYDNAASASASSAAHRQNVFDALSSEAFTKPIKEEKVETKPQKGAAPVVTSSTSSIQKTSLAEYKERRERERALSKSASMSDASLKSHVKSEPGLSVEGSEKEKLKRSLTTHMAHSGHHRHHHSKHHGMEGVAPPDPKLRIKTEPSPSSLSSIGQRTDPKLKLPSGLNSSKETIRPPEAKFHVKEESASSPSVPLSSIIKTEPNTSESEHRKEMPLSSNVQLSAPEPKLIIKSEPSSPQVPTKPEVKLKIKNPLADPGITQPGSSPLKLKIKTSHIPKDAQYSEKNGHKEQKVPALKLSSHPSRIKSGDSSSSSKHSHKSHKSSKHSHSSSSSHKGTNGKEELKIHITLSDIQKQGSASEAEKKVPEKHHRHLEKHRNDGSASQKDLTSRSKSDASSSRKRPLVSTGDVTSNDTQSHPRSKVQRSNENQVRRSTSSHSVVSMELSSDTGSVSGDMENHMASQGIINDLQKVIELQKRNIAESQSGKSSPVVQQGFSMSQPAYPQFAQMYQPQPPPPPPPEPPTQPPPPPPPQDNFSFSFSQSSQSYNFDQMAYLTDMDFLEDDPPLPDEHPPLRPPSPPLPPPPHKY